MLKMRFQCHVKISSDYMIYKVNLNPRIYDYTISWGKKNLTCAHLCVTWIRGQGLRKLSSPRKKGSCKILKCQLAQLQ